MKSRDNGGMTELIHNTTIDTLLERRSICKFSNEALSSEVIATLETVAQHAPSSQFLNDWSAIRVTDPDIKTNSRTSEGSLTLRRLLCCTSSYSMNIAMPQSHVPKALRRAMTRSH